VFDDPKFREVALARIRSLNKLADDLAGIVHGAKPTEADLESAVVLQGSLLSECTVPCMIGMAHNHPILGSQVITTSQLFAADPHGHWVRSFSRFYRLVPACSMTRSRVQ